MDNSILAGKPIRGNKSGRLIGKDTATYQLFEKLFLDLGDEKLPFTLPPMEKGQAINMAMGLNRCQVQWAKGQGLDASFLTRSAKAKDPAREDGRWLLEISKNQRHTQTAPAWMQALLDRPVDSATTSAFYDTTSSPSGRVGPAGPDVLPEVYVPRLGSGGSEEEGEESNADKALRLLGFGTGEGQKP